MRRERFTDDDIDEMLEELTEKELLWGIFQQSIQTNKHLSVIATAAYVALGLFALAILGTLISVLAAR